MGADTVNKYVQISNLFSARRGRSSITTGFEYRRNLSNSVTLGLQNEALGGEARVPSGVYIFPNLAAFANERPFLSSIDVDRFSSGNLRPPDFSRRYRSSEYSAFIQDDLKLARSLSLNLGFRYEYYGPPHNTDRSRDVNFYFGAGSTITERLANGALRPADQNSGDLTGRVYRGDFLNFAPSIGIAWDIFGRGHTVLRAGYAMALDRVFDTVRDLRSNNTQSVVCVQPVCEPRFVIPAVRMLPLLSQALGPAPVVQLDENLRTPYAQNWYAGLQQELSSNSWLEIGHAGSVGRKLISRDAINRFARGVLSRFNPNISDDTFLSNAGNSNYLALETSLRRSFNRGLQYQVSYTFSHAIDNQSDIFEGIRTGTGALRFALSTFTRQFDARLDRGNANFDQRHNLVFNAIWELPTPNVSSPLRRWLIEGWTVSTIGAYRSGFPVTAIDTISPSTPTGLRNNRLDFIGEPDNNGRLSSAQSVPGGVQWLDALAFQPASAGVGTLGRGALQGPGFWNYDFAVLKTLALREEKFRVQFRAELYNLLNHPNLSIPESIFLRGQSPNPEFGRAYFGLNRTFSRFGDLPLENPSRRIQFALRLQF